MISHPMPIAPTASVSITFILMVIPIDSLRIGRDIWERGYYQEEQ